jgi:hypothetical protein
MNRRRKYDNPPPRPMTVAPSPAEIVELTGDNPRPAGTPVELVPAGPPPEIIVGEPVPRKQLELVLGIDATLGPAGSALGGARLASILLAADRKLRLAVDAERSRVAAGECVLILIPAEMSVETAAKLEKIAAAVPAAVAEFPGASLRRVAVVPRD